MPVWQVRAKYHLVSGGSTRGSWLVRESSEVNMSRHRHSDSLMASLTPFTNK